MFLDFLIKLKESKLPVSLNEFLTFLDSLKLDIVEYGNIKFKSVFKRSKDKIWDLFRGHRSLGLTLQTRRRLRYGTYVFIFIEFSYH